MAKATGLALSTNLQKAVRWIGETMQEHPEKQRNRVIEEAQLRFDLNPAECGFLSQNFSDITSEKDREEN